MSATVSNAASKTTRKTSSAAPTARPARARGKALQRADQPAAVSALLPLGGTPAALPLSALELSPQNMRKTPAQGIEELAALIASQGLLQPLCVTNIEASSPARYAVVAGGRRLRALQLLAERGTLAADAPVDCRVFRTERAAEVTLAENSARQAMHPADQCEAFKALADAGQPIEVIAQRFGVTALTVQRRLRLANVAPDLIALHRTGEATLEQMQALAITDDWERQRLVWFSADCYSRSAWQLRARLLDNEVPATDDRVRFVGLAAYEAAGGAVRRDLFSERDEVFVTDVALLEQLLADRLDLAAEEVRAEGWSWCDVRSRFDTSDRLRFRTLPQSRRDFTAQEAEALAALRARAKAAEEAVSVSDDDDEAYEDRVAEAERLAAQVEAFEASAVHWSAEDLARAGAVVTFERGRLLVWRGLVRPARTDGIASFDGPAAGRAQEEAAPARAEFSERLMLSLTAHWTAAIQASLIARTDVALALLAQRLAMSVFLPLGASKLRISLHTCDGLLEKAAPDLAGSRAGSAIDAARSRWEAMVPKQPAALLRWLLAQPRETVLELIAFCTAVAFDAMAGTVGQRERDETQPLAQALALDMADWWQPTAGGYFEALSKAKIAQTVAEVLGADQAAGLADMKKADAARVAEQRLAGTRWVPAPLRDAPPIEDDDDEEDGAEA